MPNHIVILGASATAVKAAEHRRESDPPAEVTIVTFEDHYPYRKEFFSDFLAGDCSLTKLYCRPKDSYEKKGIKVLVNQKLARINLKRRRIGFEDRESLDFDELIVTEPPAYRLADIKGNQKEGVFGARRLADIKQIAARIPLVDAITIQSLSPQGLALAQILAGRGKTVELIVLDEKELFCCCVPQTPSTRLAPWLERGLRVLPNVTIQEILGDSFVKAIRLQTGKVLASDLVILPDAVPDMRIFRDTELALSADERIVADAGAGGRTNVEYVYALGEAAAAGAEGVVGDVALPVLRRADQTAAAGEGLAEQPPAQASIGQP